MANKIRETLTDDVIEEILSQFYETSCSPDSFEFMKGWIDALEEVETWEDKARFLEMIEGMNERMISPWDHLLTHYLTVKEKGLQTADRTGMYICTGCRTRIFKRVGQKITPCECFSGRWQFYWDWEAENFLEKEKAQTSEVPDRKF